MDHKGWHSRGYLPHLDAPGVIQAVTFRLADSLPAAVLERLADAPEHIRRRSIASHLDAGYGACHLAAPDVAAKVEQALLFGDGDRYRLLAWVVMPNHVHVLIQPEVPLPGIVQSWKSFTAKTINRVLGLRGRFWQPDYYDRFIREDGHLHTVITYIEGNPVNAGLCCSAEEWLFSSAKWRIAGETPALPIPHSPRRTKGGQP